jgi:hypothetical protein
MEIFKIKACLYSVLNQSQSRFWIGGHIKKITKDENCACPAPDRAQMNSYHNINKHDVLQLNMITKKQVISPNGGKYNSLHLGSYENF